MITAGKQHFSSTQPRPRRIAVKTACPSTAMSQSTSVSALIPTLLITSNLLPIAILSAIIILVSLIIL